MSVVWVGGIFGNIFKILNGDFQTHGQAFQNSSSLAASYVALCNLWIWGKEYYFEQNLCCAQINRLNKILKIFEKKIQLGPVIFMKLTFIAVSYCSPIWLPWLINVMWEKVLSFSQACTC